MAERAINLHVGAHKTATTYLQQYLAFNCGLLAKEGVAYWLTENVRGTIKHALEQDKRDALSVCRRLAARLRGDRLSDRMRTWFALDRDILLSEENLLGEGTDFMNGEFYPDAGARLEWFAQVIPPDRPLNVWLCIRNYADFLASMYGEAARFWPVPSPQDYAKFHINPEGCWPALLDRIQKSLPQAKLHVWAYEDFHRIEPYVIKRMTGVDQSLLHTLPQSNVRPSASDRAIREAAALHESVLGAERMMKMREFEEVFPIQDGSERFSPWTEEQRETMDTNWQSDLAKIEARTDLVFLK